MAWAIDETRLPGIGTRLEFVTEDKRRMGVVQHHGGRRESSYASRGTLRARSGRCVSLKSMRSLVDALGVLSVGKDAAARTYEVEGQAFEWLDVDFGSSVVEGPSVS